MFLMFDSRNWINNILRPIFGGIDALFYSLLSWIIEGIFNISSVMANIEFLKVLYNRVYVVLSVFMVFKLTFSFIKYLVNPDAMSDKEQGVGKVIFRTIAMVCMLIILPIIFFSNDLDPKNSKPIIYALQDATIKTIPRLVLGIEEDPSATTSSTTAKENGDTMALYMLRSFYYDSECDDARINKNECDITASGIASVGDFLSSLNQETKNGEYAFKYQWPLSTIAGIIMVITMVGVCIDVAIRAFKLIILQMMAPIPVMSFIDPKSSKDGAFNSWIKTFISTYIDIFIKLLILYLTLMLVSRLFATGDRSLFGDSISSISNFMSRTYVRVFLVIGLLKFAKDAPKFIKDSLGIKDSGGGGGFMGKALAGLGGAAAGFAGGVMAGGLAGGLSGAMQGASGAAAASGTNKPFKAFSNARDDAAKMRTGNQNARGGLLGRAQQAAVGAEGRKIARRELGLTSNAANTGTLDKMKGDNLRKKSAATNAEKLSQLWKERGLSAEHAAAVGDKLSNMGTDLEGYMNEYEYESDGLGGWNKGGINYSTGAALENISDTLATESAKSDSAYGEMSKYAEQMHVKRGVERYSRGGRFKDKVDEKRRPKDAVTGKPKETSGDIRAQNKANDIGWNK